MLKYNKSSAITPADTHVESKPLLAAPPRYSFLTTPSSPPPLRLWSPHLCPSLLPLFTAPSLPPKLARACPTPDWARAVYVCVCGGQTDVEAALKVEMVVKCNLSACQV